MKKFFGVIGNPVKHSLSPILHNYWFDKYKIDADYSIIESTDKDLPQIIQKIKDGIYSGINVTLPFKQRVINHIDKVINDAELTGSVNTIFLDRDKNIIIGLTHKITLNIVRNDNTIYSHEYYDLK